MTEIIKNDWTVYVLVRNDLPSMNAGKAMAQVHHAGVQLMSMYPKSPVVQKYITDGISNGACHFNTTLVLSATKSQIETALELIPATSLLQGIDFECGSVVDPEYPFIVPEEISPLIIPTTTLKKIGEPFNGQVPWVREELTCAWFLGNRINDLFKNAFKEFKLHP